MDSRTQRRTANYDGERPTQRRRPGLSLTRRGKAPPTNLPVIRDALIGRDDDLAAAQQLVLRDHVGLVTLTGAGGSGKTRLAIQVAWNVLDAFDDGVYFVSLAQVSDPTLVSAEIVHALGLQGVPGMSPRDTLGEHVRDRHLLLVLDNFEHLLPEAPLVAELLAAATRLTVLVTSRAPLRLHGEHEYLVKPLALPALHESVTSQTASDCPSVALFMQRASAVDPALALNHQNARIVAEICVRLDGLPLALELAAGRCRVLSLPALLSRLEPRLPLLIGGPREVPARQQTLRDTIAWSYDLLDTVEQQLFRWLSVFAASWTLEAAEAVCGPSLGRDVGVLDVLTSLVSKSLIRRLNGQDGGSRFDMLETVREFAREAHGATADAGPLGERLARYMVELVESGELSLKGEAPGNKIWLERMADERANVQAVLRDGGISAELRLRLAAAYVWLWYVHGHHSEGRGWLLPLLQEADSAPPEIRAKALHGLGVLANQDGDFAEAQVRAQDALIAYEAAGDERGTALALALLGRVARAQGALPEAAALLERSTNLYRETENAWGVAYSLHRLGEVELDRGDAEEAEVAVAESLALRREIGDLAGVGITLVTLGRIALQQGDYPRARRLLTESLPILDEVGSRAGRSTALWTLATLARRQADVRRAVALCTEALEISYAVGNRISVAGLIEELAAIAVNQGRAEDAVRLFAAASTLRQRIGAPAAPRIRTAREHDLVRARTALGKRAFAALWSEGRTLTVRQAIDNALSIDVDDAPPPPAPGGLLTRREREVATLIGQGLTSRQIAERLAISSHTADAHAEHIREKLGLRSRAQIAAWVVEQGAVRPRSD
jgi:non-specific serine/threonine protein kinase